MSAQIEHLEHALVCRTVDASRQARHHLHAGVGQLAAQRAGNVTPRRCGVTRTDEGHPATLEQRPIAAREQHRHRQRVVSEHGRMPRLPHDRDLETEVGASLPHRMGPEPLGTAGPRGPQRRPTLGIVEHPPDEPVAGWQPPTGHGVCLGRWMLAQQREQAVHRHFGEPGERRRIGSLGKLVGAGRRRLLSGPAHAASLRADTRNRTRNCNASATCSARTI